MRINIRAGKIGLIISLVLMTFLNNAFAEDDPSKEKFYADLSGLSPKTHLATKLVDHEILFKCGNTPSVDYLINLMSTPTFAILISLPNKFQPHYATSAVEKIQCPASYQHP
jgi:hypothetical protein